MLIRYWPNCIFTTLLTLKVEILSSLKQLPFFII